MIGVGIGFMFVGGFALFMMHVTQSIPRRWPWLATQRHEDPEGFRNHQAAYAAFVALGAALVLAGLILGWIREA